LMVLISMCRHLSVYERAYIKALSLQRIVHFAAVARCYAVNAGRGGRGET